MLAKFPPVVLFCLFAGIAQAQNAEFWNAQARGTLDEALAMQGNRNIAKNIMFFMGDGMGISSVTAGRILAGQLDGMSGEENRLEFEKFPYLSLIKTYETDKQVPDSAGTATAMLTGVKTKYKMIGVDESANYEDCPSSTNAHLNSVLKWAMDAGKSTGLITQSRVTHASPAPLYAHSPSRNWEFDGEVPERYRQQCPDHALQLVHNTPGKDIQVILGGGRENFHPITEKDPALADQFGYRLDGRNLVNEWKDDKESRNLNHAYVWNKAEFDAVDVKSTDYLLGLFAPSKLDQELDRKNSGPTAQPSLSDMVQKAVKILSKNPKGFFLFVENSKIDNQHHYGKAVRAISEVVNLNTAVKKGLELIDLANTLFIVTADHSQGMVFTGYPSRGHPIFGKLENNEKITDHLPYTSLLYGAGPGYNLNGTRHNIKNVNTSNPDYIQQAAVPRYKVAHAGEDVALFANGPMAHLFHATHEQNYIAHVMAYSACIGQYADKCMEGRAGGRSAAHTFQQTHSINAICLGILTMFILKRH